MKPFEIVELGSAGREAEWQIYVKNTPAASMYHALEWRDVLQRAFGHRSWYLMALDDGKARGVLPLVEMKSLLFGHFFVSLPFLDYGGILADAEGRLIGINSMIFRGLGVAIPSNRAASFAAQSAAKREARAA